MKKLIMLNCLLLATVGCKAKAQESIQPESSNNLLNNTNELHRPVQRAMPNMSNIDSMPDSPMKTYWKYRISKGASEQEGWNYLKKVYPPAELQPYKESAKAAGINTD